jgi:hypothetical protein
MLNDSGHALSVYLLRKQPVDTNLDTMRDRIPVPLTTLFMGLLLLICLPLQAAVEARLSAPTTSLEQPVELILENDDEQRDSPDLSVLEDDFEILGRASQQSMSIINGSVSAKHSLILTLLPKRAGKLTIPPIPFGDQQTAQLSLEVSEQPDDPAAGGAREAWVEMSVNKETAYPEEEVILTLKLYQAADVRGEYLDKPQASPTDTRLQLLDESQYTIRQHGRPYRVLQRSYGLYAYQSGPLEIAPVTFRGRSGGASVFSLFDAPFGTPSQPSRIIRAKSESISLQVNPIPAAFTGDHWLPAKHLQLVETGIDPNAPIYAGKPLTRRIMLTADGLTSSQLPVITPPIPDEIKTYEERPQLKDTPRGTGISSSRESVVTLIPTRAGRFTLPAIEIPWWNTQSGKQELARLPELTLQVMPGTATNSPAAAASPVQSQTGDKAVASTDEEGAEPAVTSTGETPWLVWALIAAWLVTLLGWWLSHRRHTHANTLSTSMTAETPKRKAGDRLIEGAVEAVIEAYRMCDAEAARRAWLHWGQLKWPDSPPNNLARLAIRCPQEVADGVLALEKALYSPEEASDWSNIFDPATLTNGSGPVPEKPPVGEQLLPLNP